MEFCLICSREEGHGHKAEKNIEFVCSRCVQILLRENEDDLNRAYAKAIKHG